jgi:hypothetical protein
MKKSITVKTINGSDREIAVDTVRYLKIVDAEAKGGPQKAKIVLGNEKTPVLVEQPVNDLRGPDLPLVYVGGGVYVPRALIRHIEPISDKDRQGLADAKKVDASKFQTRIVLTGGLTPVWGVKTIDQLNERGIIPEAIHTTAAVTMLSLELTKSVLTAKAVVPGADEAKVREAADAAKAGCPISKVLRLEIELDLTIEA